MVVVGGRSYGKCRLADKLEEEEKILEQILEESPLIGQSLSMRGISSEGRRALTISAYPKEAQKHDPVEKLSLSGLALSGGDYLNPELAFG
jgi:hypothetical protein